MLIEIIALTTITAVAAVCYLIMKNHSYPDVHPE